MEEILQDLAPIDYCTPQDLREFRWGRVSITDPKFHFRFCGVDLIQASNWRRPEARKASSDGSCATQGPKQPHPRLGFGVHPPETAQTCTLDTKMCMTFRV